MKLLEEKVALITGASRGIGKAIALEFAKQGCNIAFTDVREDENMKACQAELEAMGVKAKGYAANAASFEDSALLVENVVKEFGRIDVLVNNAGIMDGMEPVGEITDEKWDRVFSVNTRGVMQAMRLAVNLFLEQGHGVIVNNISAGGLRGGRAGAAYVASKHAVTGLTANTGYMYAQSGIRCNGIAPGGVETNIQSSMTGVSQFGAGRQMTGSQTMPRLGKPDEVAQLALFLGSDDSSFINGQVIAADAGWTA